MKEQFNKIADLVCKDLNENRVDDAELLCKLMEEVGELAKEVNRRIGIKDKKDLTYEQIRANVLEESADVIQIVFGLAFRFGILYEEIMETLDQKNLKYEKVIHKRKQRRA